MAKRNVADLHATLSATARPYEEAMRRAAASTRNAETSITRSLRGITQAGAKFGLGFFGAQTIGKGIERELKSVIANIENIQGVDPETVASVKKFEGNIAQAKQTLDQFVAGGVSAAVEGLEALRYQLDAVRFGDEEAKRLQGERTAEAKKAINDSPEMIKKRAEATRELAEARAELAHVGEAESARIVRLRTEAAVIEKSVADLSAEDVKKMEAQTQATKMLTAAEESYVELKRKEAAAQSEAGAALAFYSGVALTGAASVAALEQAVTNLQLELYDTDSTSAAGLEKRIELFQKLTVKAEQLEKATARVNKLGEELGMTFASAFEDAIVSGGELSEVLRGLAQDVLRIFVRETVTAPAAGFLSDIFKNIAGRADGGPISAGRPYMVGEEGPELVVPRGSGTVIPAGRTAAMMGGAGSRQVFNFSYNFASGVTRQEVAAMLPRLVEASKRAVADAAARGGSYGRAWE